TPVSYVAPLREVSILIGTAMGARLLAEGRLAFPRAFWVMARIVLDTATGADTPERPDFLSEISF
nr:hypothetical protein [Alphaproteobacteria bacterium]